MTRRGTCSRRERCTPAASDYRRRSSCVGSSLSRVLVGAARRRRSPRSWRLGDGRFEPLPDGIGAGGTWQPEIFVQQHGDDAARPGCTPSSRSPRTARESRGRSPRPRHRGRRVRGRRRLPRRGRLARRRSTAASATRNVTYGPVDDRDAPGGGRRLQRPAGRRPSRSSRSFSALLAAARSAPGRISEADAGEPLAACAGNLSRPGGVERPVEGRPPDDVALAERAKHGDERAFEELVRMYQGIAFRTAYLLTGSAADAEDAVQTGFVKAWSALPRFRPGAAFRPWLLRIVANEAHNRRRSGEQRRESRSRLRAAAADASGRRGPVSRRGPPSSESSARSSCARWSGSTSAIETCSRAATSSSFRRTRRRTVLGVRRGTVKSRTSRALERLREEVEP